MSFNVPVAVAIFAVPNLLTSAWQAWTYRGDQASRLLTWGFALGGAAGTALGTLLLAHLPGKALTLVVAGAVFLYVGFRLARPYWVLPFRLAERMAPVTGVLGGILFGASALSAPVSLSFLNAMKLDRRVFVATISLFFFNMGVVQAPALLASGIMDRHLLLMSTAAILPVLAGMPAGAWLTQHVSRDAFDRIILAVLTGIALKLVLQGLG